MQCEECGKKVYANEVCSCGLKAPKKNNGKVAANTIICFILLMITVFSLILTLSLRTAVNKNMVIESIEEAELSEIVVDGKKLDQYIYDEYVDDPRITVENVNNLLKEDFIKNFITEKAEAYQDYFLDKGEMPYITSDEIIELIDDNADILYEEAGLRFLEGDKEELRRELSKLDSFKKDSDDFFNSSFGSALPQTYFSYANVVFLSIMMAVIFIQWLIFYKANSRRASKMIYKYGLAAAIPSFIILVTAVVCRFAVDPVGKLFGSAAVTFMIYSVIFLFIGIIFTALGIIANKHYKSSLSESTAKSIDKTGVVPEDDKQSLLASDANPSAEISASGEAPPIEPIKNICPTCSFVNKDTSKYCSRCGTKLK